MARVSLIDETAAADLAVAVPQADFEPLRAHYDDRAVVEVTVLAAAYSMHTRPVCARDIRG